MMHEQAIALERERILADLHDGLGASLIGLLRHVQSGKADRSSIERRVKEALQEMRIAIDALWPQNGLTRIARLERPSELTAREIDVLSALARGYTYAGIADRLGISLGTVTSHIKNIYRKLIVHSGTAAVTRAAELGVLSLSGGDPPAH